MAISEKLKVRRDQLAKFIEDHDTIRQFERLFEYINTFVIPSASTEESIQDAAHPIGEEYWQLPGKKPPMELYPAQTWVNISSAFSGDFFRAEGGNASAFESGQQLDASQGWQLGADEDLTGAREYWGETSTRDRLTDSSAGANNTLMRLTTTGQGSSIMISAKNDGTNGDIRKAIENRSVNQTIRIWERTA